MHPSTAFLIIEVAQTSQSKDRQVKAPLYAAAGIPELWLIDIPAGVVEVSTHPRGEQYRHLTRHMHGDTITLQAFPDMTLRVDEVLP